MTQILIFVNFCVLLADYAFSAARDRDSETVAEGMKSMNVSGSGSGVGVEGSAG